MPHATFVSVTEAARRLASSTYLTWQLCETQALESHWDVDGHRLIRLSSLKAYMDNLPTEERQ